MKNLLPLLFLLSYTSSFAQVLDNPGFEEWESTTGPNDEPVEWSSIQTGEPDNLANFASQVMFQSTDAHSGDYSVRLKNKYISIAQVVANGIVTNGRCHLNLNPQDAYIYTDTANADYHTLCSTRPDSLVGYYKYVSMNNDKTLIQALLHTGFGKFPDADSSGWIGFATFTGPPENVDDWTRFSVPFEYFEEGNPEYILINISAGNSFDAQQDSEGWYDDLELVYNPVGLNENVAAQLLNIYSYDHRIYVDMRKFGAGEAFELSVFSITGQLVLSDQLISGYKENWPMENTGVYICRLESKDGLVLTKKVVVY